jgi:hypothetical protein
MSVRVELQADCFAGVWANHAQKARNILEQGDIEEAMNAAQKIGDDALQAPPAARWCRELHPRHQRAAPALVLRRAAGRQREGLRHLQHRNL